MSVPMTLTWVTLKGETWMVKLFWWISLIPESQKILGSPTYAHMVLNTATKFSMVTHRELHVFRGQPCPSHKGHSLSTPQFFGFSSIYLCLHPLTQSDQIQHGTTYGRGLFKRGHCPSAPILGVLPYLCLHSLNNQTQHGDICARGVFQWPSLHFAQTHCTISQQKPSFLFNWPIFQRG